MVQRNKKNYNGNIFNFRSCLVDVFGTGELSKIHENEDCNFGILSIENDQGTHFHKRFYEKIWETNFFDLYHEFVRENILPMFNEDILYQIKQQETEIHDNRDKNLLVDKCNRRVLLDYDNEGNSIEYIEIFKDENNMPYYETKDRSYYKQAYDISPN